MQPNNKLRQFSGDTTNILSDSEYESDVVTQGAGKNTVANSALYNSLSKSTTGITTAVADFIASQNPSVEIGQNSNIETLISAVNNAIPTKSYTQNAINTLSNGIQDGTIIANNATKIQNVDLSDNTPSEFGNNIISKKKLVWTGNLSSSALNPIIALTDTISQGNKYVVEGYTNFTDTTASYSGKRYFSVNIIVNNIGLYDSSKTNYSQCSVSSDVFYITSANGITTSSNSYALNISAISNSQFRVADATNINGGSGSNRTLVFEKIYKIIE